MPVHLECPQRVRKNAENGYNMRMRFLGIICAAALAAQAPGEYDRQPPCIKTGKP
jgi:hypothetical protein